MATIAMCSITNLCVPERCSIGRPLCGLARHPELVSLSRGSRHSTHRETQRGVYERAKSSKGTVSSVARLRAGGILCAKRRGWCCRVGSGGSGGSIAEQREGG